MKKFKLTVISAVMALTCSTAISQSNQIQRCVDNDGNVTYSNGGEKGLKCEKTDIAKRVMQITNHGGTGFAPTNPVVRPSEPNAIPKVTKEEQKKKDVNRIAILENELKDEIENINKVEKMIAAAGTDAAQVNELNSIKDRHMQNIKSLQREIDLQKK